MERCATNAGTLDKAIVQANNILEDYMALLERDNLIIPEATPYEKINAPIKQRIAVPKQNALEKGLNFSQVAIS